MIKQAADEKEMFTWVRLIRERINALSKGEKEVIFKRIIQETKRAIDWRKKRKKKKEKC